MHDARSQGVDLIGDGRGARFLSCLTDDALLKNNVINLDHSSVTAEMRKLKTAIEMVESFNRQAQPSYNGVHDKRFQEAELSAAKQVIKLARSEPNFREFAQLYQVFCEEGYAMDEEEMTALKKIMEPALNSVKASATVVGLTINALSVASNQRGLGTHFDAVCLDEGGRVDLAAFGMIVANIETNTIYTSGDTTQFGPTAPNVTGPRGCMKDLSMSIMEYLHKNHWPSTELWLQRRGAPGIGAISSPMFYRNKMVDAPCTSLPGAHQRTATILRFFKNLFPECDSNLPVRFIDLRGRIDLRDELTGSWYSPDEAAVIINIAEKGIIAGVFTASDVPVITHYSAQQKVFRHAFAKLSDEFPGHGFDKLMDHTTDTFQGRGVTMPIGSPVRTTKTGFSGDRGRNCVLMTRAQDFSLTVANVNNLVTNTGRGTPPMKAILYTAHTKRVAAIVNRASPHEALMSHRYVH
ncbi:hypothetical protein IFR05_006186 [Cadophora sp. M221]|nr:hypothetical protein IFR05_006186 [Cadophora sp. M221]